MALTDALLLDPFPFEMFIAKRTDGVKGSGTLNDPYDASTAPRFDGIMNALPGPTCVHLGPGEFETNGYSDHVPGGWQMKRQICILFVSFVLIPSVARADYIFSPNPASRNITSPNALLVSGVPSIRMQEVHSASDFLGAGSPILLITGISYSAPSWSGRVPIDVTLPNIQIRMSTTSKNPDALSMNFADNIGANEAVVLSGSLHLYETELERYDIHIPITPFAYDPSAGNLLIDTFNYATLLSPIDPDWTFDAVDRYLDSVSLLSSGSSGVNSPTGGFSTGGFMMRFTYTAVPEPTTWAILGIGLLALRVLRLKRGRDRSKQ